MKNDGYGSYFRRNREIETSTIYVTYGYLTDFFFFSFRVFPYSGVPQWVLLSNKIHPYILLDHPHVHHRPLTWLSFFLYHCTAIFSMSFPKWPSPLLVTYVSKPPYTRPLSIFSNPCNFCCASNVLISDFVLSSHYKRHHCWSNNTLINFPFHFLTNKKGLSA